MNANFSLRLAESAERTPHKRGVVLPIGEGADVSYAQLTYGQLESRCSTYTSGLRAAGIKPGMRVVLMVRPGLEFLPLIFAVIRVGAVPVLIDPGMGRGNLLRCIASVQAEALIAIPLVHLIRRLKPRFFRGIRIHVSIGHNWFGGLTLPELTCGSADSAVAESAIDDPAAIIFTTGSTGPPKGVLYTHGMFNAQTTLLRDTFGLTSDDIDMPGFALFAIFSVGIGMTIVLPDMDPTRPAQVVPERILEAIENHGVTFSFGSPALWNRVSEHCVQHAIKLPTLRVVLMAGAPIPGFLHERMLTKILTEGAEVYTPYGATECLPVTSFRGSDVLAETLAMTASGKGYCVGEPLPGITVRIIRVSDKPIADWSGVSELPLREIGEIVVSGPVVSREYFELPDKTAEHKIADGERFWHRIGDLGYFDEQARLWFCGRKGHRVETGEGMMCTVCCESIFNQHPDVFRSALVGIGSDRYAQKPVMIVEPRAFHFPEAVADKTKFREELAKLAAANPLTAGLADIRFHPEFPVDIRHNAKIFREKLAIWAGS
ncbi:MAG: acyl-CoA synthetase (AMP-forming)/AMP-acid ligase II [Rhodothermales bacterium]